MKTWPNRPFLDRLALPHMSINFWKSCCSILFNFQELRRTFPKSVLEIWIDVDHQIWGNTPIGWHKFNGPIGTLPQTWRTNRSFAPNLMAMTKRHTFPAFCRNHKAFVIVLPGISWGLQILYYLTEFRTSVVGSRACSSAIRAICNQRHLLLSIWINDLEEGSYWSISLCRPIGVFPQIWWWTVVLSSRTDLGNVLLSSWKLNRIPQKLFQKLVYICGRANLSRNGLFGHVFIDLKSVENSAPLSEGSRHSSQHQQLRRGPCLP